MAKGRAKVMRDGVHECLQFPIGAFELCRPLGEFMIEPLDFPFAAFAIGYIVVGFQDRGGPVLIVTLQGPTAGDDDLRTVALASLELAVPATGPHQLRENLFERGWKNRV